MECPNLIVSNCIISYADAKTKIKKKKHYTLRQCFPTGVSRQRRERPPGVSRKILEKYYLGTSNFAVLVHELRRETSVSSGVDLLFRKSR